jgi:hypothetical protein
MHRPDATPARTRGFACLALALAPALVLAQKPQPPVPPAWLEARIAEYKRLPPASPPRSIVATRHEGKTVYYVSAACCDIPSELYDEHGTLLCYPGGGFAGGDGRCPTFVLGRETVTRIWRDDRAPGPSSPRASGNGK